MQEAKVGRIVHYFVGIGTEPLAGIITRVHGPSLVNLDLFATNTGYEGPEHPTSVCRLGGGDTVNVWDWPARD